MASLPPCRLYGAAIPRAPPLGPGRALTLPCGWNNAGPGAGPWEFRTPAEMGLDGAALDRAEEYVHEEIAGRQCWLVAKDGFIVQERCA